MSYSDSDSPKRNKYQKNLSDSDSNTDSELSDVLKKDLSKRNKYQKDLSDSNSDLSDSGKIELENEIRKLKQQLKTSKQRIKELTLMNEDLEDEVDDITTSKNRQIKKLDKSIKDLLEEIDDIISEKEELVKFRNTCKDKDREIKGLKLNIDELKMSNSKEIDELKMKLKEQELLIEKKDDAIKIMQNKLRHCLLENHEEEIKKLRSLLKG